MKKNRYDGRGAEKNTSIDWVEFSEKMNSDDRDTGYKSPADRNEPGSSDIVNETISQIVSEEYLKVDTSDLEGVRDAVDAFYAYDRPKVKKKKKKPEEKVIIRSDELKAGGASSDKAAHPAKRRSSAESKAPSKGTAAAASGRRTAHLGRKKKHAGPAPASESFRHAKGLEKYRKLGILPTKKDGPSEFRKESAKWRYDDVPKAEVNDDVTAAADADEESFADRLKKFTPVQWGSVAMAAVILITSV
ncbi:MAG: hypothetical protein K6G58_05825, partial [Lachnospiraceae bacterium]|nr:hypothetical protein [Lachnospiraceae bacterium]